LGTANQRQGTYERKSRKRGGRGGKGKISRTGVDAEKIPLKHMWDVVRRLDEGGGGFMGKKREGK